MNSFCTTLASAMPPGGATWLGFWLLIVAAMGSAVALAVIARHTTGSTQLLASSLGSAIALVTGAIGVVVALRASDGAQAAWAAHAEGGQRAQPPEAGVHPAAVAPGGGAKHRPESAGVGPSEQLGPKSRGAPDAVERYDELRKALEQEEMQNAPLPLRI